MLNMISNIEKKLHVTLFVFRAIKNKKARIDIDGQHKGPYIESLKGIISKKSCWRKYFSKEQFETLNVVFIHLL